MFPQHKRQYRFSHQITLDAPLFHSAAPMWLKLTEMFQFKGVMWSLCFFHCCVLNSLCSSWQKKGTARIGKAFQWKWSDKWYCNRKMEKSLHILVLAPENTYTSTMAKSETSHWGLKMVHWLKYIKTIKDNCYQPPKNKYEWQIKTYIVIKFFFMWEDLWHCHWHVD